MLKKAFSAALAFIAVASSMTGIYGSAYICTYEDGDHYDSRIAQYEGKFTSCPELVDVVNSSVFGMNHYDESAYCTRVWRLDDGSDKKYSEYVFEVHDRDALYLRFKDIEVTPEEICSLIDELGMAEKAYSITESEELIYQGQPDLCIFFNDEENNLESANTIVQAIMEKYGDALISAGGRFDRIQFPTLDFYWTHAAADDKSKMDDALKSGINEKLKENGFDVTIQRDNEKVFYPTVTMPDDYTDYDKFRLDTFMVENYGIRFYTYGIALYTGTNTKCYDFLCDPVTGDANLDSKATIADSVAILQHIANRDKYELKPQGRLNADVDGVEGVTANDALTLQKWDANK